MIFEQDIKKERQQKWHVTENTPPLRTLDQAREFLNGVGFCLAYPVRPSPPAPTFIGAYVGSEEKLPSAKQAFADANARAATELIVRLLSEKSAFEVAFGEDASLLVSVAEFPYFYALVGDRNPKAAPSPGLRGEQALTTHTFQIIDEHGPINEDEMRRKLGREISRNAIEKVLQTLWSKLRITRVDSGIENGEPVEPVWDLMHRWAPEVVNLGKQISQPEALSALISKYLETVVVAEQKDIEDFFSRLVPRSRVTQVIKAMLTAQEFTFVQVSGKNMLRLASRGGEEALSATPALAGRQPAATEHKVRPWQARERGKKESEEKRAKHAERAERPAGAFQKFQKDRKPFPRSERTGGSRPFGDRKPFGERKGLGAPKRFGDSRPKRFGDRKPFGDGAKPFGPRKSFGESGKSFSDRKSFAGRRPGAERKAFGDRPDLSKHRPPFSKDHSPREVGERGGFKKPFGAKKPFAAKKPFSDKKPFDPKSFGGKKSLGKPFAKRKPASGERPSLPPWLREKKPRREGPTE